MRAVVFSVREESLMKRGIILLSFILLLFGSVNAQKDIAGSKAAYTCANCSYQISDTTLNYQDRIQDVTTTYHVVSADFDGNYIGAINVSFKTRSPYCPLVIDTLLPKYTNFSKESVQVGGFTLL